MYNNNNNKASMWRLDVKFSGVLYTSHAKTPQGLSMDLEKALRDHKGLAVEDVRVTRPKR